MTTRPNRVSSQSLAAGASVREIADAVRTAGRRAVDVAGDALARLAAIAPLNAMVHVDTDLARRTAKRVDARVAQGGALPLAGVPSVSIPVGCSAQTGLPVGLMLEGPWGSDRRLLAIARRIDARLRDGATAA